MKKCILPAPGALSPGGISVNIGDRFAEQPDPWQAHGQVVKTRTLSDNYAPTNRHR